MPKGLQCLHGELIWQSIQGKMAILDVLTLRCLVRRIAGISLACSSLKIV